MARRLKELLCCLNTQSNVARLHCMCTMRCLQPLCLLVCSLYVAVLTLYTVLPCSLCCAALYCAAAVCTLLCVRSCRVCASLVVLYSLAALCRLDCLFAESSSTFWQHSRDARVACCHAHHSREARPQQPKCQNLSSQSRPNLAGVHLLPFSDIAVSETPHRAISQSSLPAVILCSGP